MARALDLLLFLALACAACGDAPDPTPSAVETARVEETTDPVYIGSAYDLPDDQIAAVARLLLDDGARSYLSFRPPAEIDPSLAFRAAKFDLDGDGVGEVIVRPEGNYFCGSGGCNLKVFRQQAGNLELTSDLILTFLPIEIAEQTSHGWRDIIVTTRKDYVPSGKVRMAFDGSRYAHSANETEESCLIVLSDSSRRYPLVD